VGMAVPRSIGHSIEGMEGTVPLFLGFTGSGQLPSGGSTVGVRGGSSRGWSALRLEVGGGGDSGLTWNHDLLGVVCGKGVAVWLVRDPAWGRASAAGSVVVCLMWRARPCRQVCGVGPIDGFTWVYTPVLGAASMPGWGCIPISVPGWSRSAAPGGGWPWLNERS
jgi:hypothetical protein